MAAQLEKRNGGFQNARCCRTQQAWDAQKVKARPPGANHVSGGSTAVVELHSNEPAGKRELRRIRSTAEPQYIVRGQEHAHPVINPYVELTKMKLVRRGFGGARPISWRRKFHADVQLLARFSSRAGRCIRSTGPSAAIVNDSAKRDLADLKTYFAPGRRRQEKTHCQDSGVVQDGNAGKSREQLLTDILRAEQGLARIRHRRERGDSNASGRRPPGDSEAHGGFQGIAQRHRRIELRRERSDAPLPPHANG